jgi:hypothetical protein
VCIVIGNKLYYARHNFLFSSVWLELHINLTLDSKTEHLINGDQWKVIEAYVFNMTYMFSLESSQRDKGPPFTLSKAKLYS